MTFEIYDSEESYDSSGNKWTDGMEKTAAEIRARDREIGSKIIDILEP